MLKKENKVPYLIETEKLYEKCSSLYLVGDDQFLSQISCDLNFPKFIDRRKIVYQVLKHIKVMVPKEDDDFFDIKDLPIAASISFLKNMVNGDIIAFSHPCSEIVHYTTYKRNLIELFPKVKENIRDADLFVVIGTSFQVNTAYNIISFLQSKTKKILVDPGEFEEDILKSFDSHIKDVATKGVKKIFDNV